MRRTFDHEREADEAFIELEREHRADDVQVLLFTGDSWGPCEGRILTISRRSVGPRLSPRSTRSSPIRRTFRDTLGTRFRCLRPDAPRNLRISGRFEWAGGGLEPPTTDYEADRNRRQAATAGDDHPCSTLSRERRRRVFGATVGATFSPSSRRPSGCPAWCFGTWWT
jgi:hypothetical protein